MYVCPHVQVLYINVCVKIIRGGCTCEHTCVCEVVRVMF